VRWAAGPGFSSSASLPLLTAGNDGAVKLWDVAKVANGMPRTLAVNNVRDVVGICLRCEP
jgi:hypothetical protein